MGLPYLIWACDFPPGARVLLVSVSGYGANRLLWIIAEDKHEGGEEVSGGLQLKSEAVADFGGNAELVAHFKAAPTPEACRNLLAVLLDHASHRLIQVGCCPSHCPGPGPGLGPACTHECLFSPTAL